MAFRRLRDEQAQNRTTELMRKVDQSLHQIGYKVKQVNNPAQTHAPQLNKINLLSVQGLQEKLDRAATLY